MHKRLYPLARWSQHLVPSQCILGEADLYNQVSDRKVPPKASPNRHHEIVTRIDPELDQIRCRGGDHSGKMIADIQGFNVALSNKFQVQIGKGNRTTATIILKGGSEKLWMLTERLKQPLPLERKFSRNVMQELGSKSPTSSPSNLQAKAQWEHALS